MMLQSTAKRAATRTKTSATSSNAAASSSSATSHKKRKVEPTTDARTTKKFDASALNSLEKDALGESWYKSLEPEFSMPYFQKLKKYLMSEYQSAVIFPAMKDIYSWSRLTPLEAVKVVVLGQDPYHDVGQAHGLSFSVLPPTKLPGSLKNIYKQIAIDFPTFTPPKDKGDLTPLAKAGVLWLNSVLTVRAHCANSHQKQGWEIFTAAVLRAVMKREDGRGVVFMAWGLPAQRTLATLQVDETKHLVLKSAHPSPLSAHRGFLGNGHFRLANEWLKERYGEGRGIEWTTVGS